MSIEKEQETKENMRMCKTRGGHDAARGKREMGEPDTGT